MHTHTLVACKEQPVCLGAPDRNEKPQLPYCHILRVVEHHMLKRCACPARIVIGKSMESACLGDTPGFREVSFHTFER